MANGDNEETAVAQEPAAASPDETSIEDWLAQQGADLSFEDWLALHSPTATPTPSVPPTMPMPVTARRPHPSSGVDITKLPVGPAWQQLIGSATKADPWRTNPAFVPGTLGHYGNPDFYTPMWKHLLDPTGMQAWNRLNERRALMGMY